MSAGFLVREIVEDDWEPYRALRLEMLADTPMAYVESLEDALAVDDAGWRKRAIGRRLDGATDGIPSVRFVAIADDGRWVGSMGCFLEGDGGPVLVGVYVTPDFRGDATGVTTALLTAVEDWARAYAPSIRLDVHEQNTRAIKSYTKRGWALTGNTIPYPLDPTKLELEMVKKL